MITYLKLLHLIIPLLLAAIYIYFILLLNRYVPLALTLIILLTVLLFFYALRTYSLLHFKPKMTKSIRQLKVKIRQSKLINIEKIFECKKIQQQLKELKYKINKNRVDQGSLNSKSSHDQIDLKKQYLNLYQQQAYCDYCKTIKPSRSYHCLKCNACILRHEKHSQLIGHCIGEGNLKIFIQYILIALITATYMISTLIMVTVNQHRQLNHLNSFEYILFALEEITLSSALLLLIKEFSISYYNAVKNITESERKQNIINSENNPFSKVNFYHQLFKSKMEYFKINKIAESDQWFQFNQEQ